jgi:signal transduction histidine kinase
MRGVSSAARLADYPPRSGRLVLLAMLVAFVLVGLFQRHHDNAAVAAVAAVVAIGAGALMVQPRGVPLPIYAVVAGAGITALCTGSSSEVGWLGICLLAGWCTISAGWRAGWVYLAAAVVVFSVEWIWIDPDPGWGPWMVGTTFTVVAAGVVRHERELVAQLRAAQAGLAESARTEERNRIARELHDVIAHTLVVSQLHVASARLAVEADPASASQALAEAERLGRESLAEVRRAVGLLRQGSDGVAPLPGAADLPPLIERFRSAGADVTLTVTGDLGAIPATSGLALYRILQEALTNAAKHASGWPVAVEVAVDADLAELVVESGAPPGSGQGVGLDSMRERAASVGGRVEAGPGGRGWVVQVEVPIGGRS